MSPKDVVGEVALVQQTRWAAEADPHEPPWGLGRLRGHWWLLASCLHLRQSRRTPVFLSLQDAPHEALVRRSHARQAVKHANIAVGWTSPTPHSGGPEALRRGDLIEPWYVDADAQPTILAWMWSHS